VVPSLTCAAPSPDGRSTYNQVLKTVTVRYFAALRESAGTGEEQVWTSAANLEQLYEELRTKYAFRLGANQIMASRNLSIVDLSTEVADGDQLVFLPPVAGG
jgi:molybdopterin converting factor small subunit